MSSALVSFLVAFAGYSALNLSQAGQKIGLETARTRRARGIALWVAATAGTSVAALVLLYAVAIGSASIVGAMAGSGLVSLALFSALVMREPVGTREIVGVAVILVAAALIGAFAGEQAAGTIDLSRLYAFFGLVTAIYVAAWVSLRRSGRFLGVVIGGFSGALGGFIPLFQKVATSGIGRASAWFSEASGEGTPDFVRQGLEVFANPYAAFWIALSIVSMVVLQVSYSRDTAIRIIPAFSTNYILVPVVGGVLCLHETLAAAQWLGVVSIVAGMLILTAKPHPEDPGGTGAAAGSP